MAQNPRGLILDLRNNGGGYLQTAVEVVSQFLPKDEVVLIEQYGTGEKQNYTSLGDGLAVDIPMVVLINEGSASASEIVAGALQDLGRAKLIGVVSYGKGSVQTWNAAVQRSGRGASHHRQVADPQRAHHPQNGSDPGCVRDNDRGGLQ